MSTKSILILCCALAMAAVACCGGVLFMVFRNLDAGTSTTVDELFAAIEAGAFAATYDTHASPELRQAVSRDKYADLGQAIKTRLGALKSKSLSQINVRQHNADSYAEVAYDGLFEHGSGKIRAKFKADGERWLIVSFHVDSPEFQKDLATVKCPHCGTPHAASARFCPQCGKPLAEEKSAAPSSAAVPWP